MQPYEKQLTDALVLSLESTGMMQVETREYEVAHNGGHLNCLLQLHTPAGNRRLAIIMKRHAYPRDIRNAIWQLESFRKDNASDIDLISMVAAEHISDGAKKDLRQHGIAYFDGGGTFYLNHQDWFIDVQRPSKPAARRDAVPLFTEAREQVVHALLHARNEYLSGLDLAELSKTSTYTVSTVLSELDRLEWITSEGSGRTLRRKLSEPGQLLDAWADAWRQRRDTKTRWYCYTSNAAKALDQIAERLSCSNIKVGILTGAAAANFLEPHLTSTDMIDIIGLPGQSNEFIAPLQLKSVDKGANVTLIERTGASLLFTQPYLPSGTAMASPFILYLDLLDGKGRNKELAAQLRQNHLKV